MPSNGRAKSKPKTGDYKQHRTRHWQHYRDLPLFTFAMIHWMLQDSTVRLGLGMREAAVCGAQFAYKDGQKWNPGIKASSTEVGEFVLENLREFWKHDVQKMATAQVWGWSAAEVTFKLVDGLWHLDRTYHRLAEDVRPLKRDGMLSGVRFMSIGNTGNVDLEFPYCYWSSYSPIAESNYGDPITRGCYAAWADKQLDGGATDVRRLFMVKDAYGGQRIGYPEEEAFIQGNQRPNRDLAMEMVEQAKSGQVVTFPTARDANGNRLWEFEDARTQANPQHILQYPKDLDVEILRGLEIPDDVLTSEASGAWQGKQVPMQAFFSSMDRWLAQMVRMVDEQIMCHLVAKNFGPDAEYQIETKPLSEQAMEMAGAGEQDPQAMGQQQPQFMSLERGVIDAASMVTAARQILDRGKPRETSAPEGEAKTKPVSFLTRMASECGAAGTNPSPGFQYGNTCWQLTGKHTERLRQLTETREAKKQEELETAKEEALQEQFEQLGRDLAEEEQQRIAGEVEAEQQAVRKAEDRKFRRSKLYRDISETIGTDDMEVIKDFRGLMEDLHGMLTSEAESYNEAFDELVDQIVGRDIKGRQKRGAFVSSLKRAADPTRIPKFDEVVQYVRDNPSVGAVLADNLGESVGSADVEAMVFEGLKRGKKQVPTFNSDETWQAALEYLNSVEPFEAGGEDTGRAFSLVRRFAHAPAGGITIAGKQFKGGQFIPKEVMAQASEEEKREVAIEDAYREHVSRRKERGQAPLSREQWKKARTFEEGVFEDQQADRDEDDYAEWLEDDARLAVMKSSPRLQAMERQVEAETERFFEDNPEAVDPPAYSAMERGLDVEIIKRILASGGEVPEAIFRHTGIDQKAVKRAVSRRRALSIAKAVGLSDDETSELMSLQRIRLAHAPAGGITIAGKQFKGGQFIPKDVLAQATPEERAALESPKEEVQSTSKEAKAAAADKKFEQLMATKTPQDAAAFRAAKAEGIAIPPAWTEVQYFGKDENIRAEGRDAKGRKQRAENPEYRQRVSNENNARIERDLVPRIKELRDTLRADAEAGNEEAKVLYLITMSGFRIGGKGDGKAKVQAFGASTLQGKHVSVDGNTVTFDFPGKKGVRQQHVVEDNVIADMMRNAKDNEPVFSTRDVKVRKAWQETYGGAKVHDIRHVVATEIAQEQLARRVPPPPKTEREKTRIIKDVAKLAADKLGNNPSQALNTYIIPSIWGKVQVAA